MTRRRRPRTPGGDRFGANPTFRGQGPTPRAPGSGSPAKKLLARSWVDPENFGPIRRPLQKLGHFFAGTDRRTDGQTDTHDRMTPAPLWGVKNFFCLYVWGKLCTTVNCAKFLPFHFVKDYANYETFGELTFFGVFGEFDC